MAPTESVSELCESQSFSLFALPWKYFQLALEITIQSELSYTHNAAQRDITFLQTLNALFRSPFSLNRHLK